MSYYRNRYGQRIHNPDAYYRAVAEDRYGYNSSKYHSNSYQAGWNDGYAQGYIDAYDDNGW